MNRTLPRRSTLLLALVIVVVDQGSKAWASSSLQGGRPLPLLPNLLSLQLVHSLSLLRVVYTCSSGASCYCCKVRLPWPHAHQRRVRILVRFEIGTVAECR